MTVQKTDRMGMQAEIDLQVATACADIPSAELFSQWVLAVLQDSDKQAGVAIRIVSEAEGLELNRRYRSGDTATNVLSFPSDLPPGIVAELDTMPLGDLVMCAPVVEREAREQGKPSADHWAHLTVHGILHLLGYDHQDVSTADRMEALETRILAQFGVADPYDSARLSHLNAESSASS
jgi:probable rRNA maturation factor